MAKKAYLYVTTDSENSGVNHVELFHDLDALKATNGNVAAAARKLGISQRIIHYKINKIGITPDWYKQEK